MLGISKLKQEIFDLKNQMEQLHERIVLQEWTFNNPPKFKIEETVVYKGIPYVIFDIMPFRQDKHGSPLYIYHIYNGVHSDVPLYNIEETWLCSIDKFIKDANKLKERKK